jgi:hypothetical protein
MPDASLGRLANHDDGASPLLEPRRWSIAVVTGLHEERPDNQLPGRTART